jgi:NAD(P)-dependent dehydrogenase (short-subunit alcohol dehydrogenase family)
MKLQNKIAIISGGASGMGASIAQFFAQEGAKVIIGDIDDEKANDVALKIEKSGGHGLAVELDVVDENQVLRLVDFVLQKFHRIDILVNCVGIAEFAPTTEVSLQQWRRVLDVNLTGVFLCCREVGKVMINQRSGKIVNFASTAGLSGVPYMAHYTASKHGVAGLTRALAVEWGKYNIHVNCICPGATATPMLLESTTEEYRADRAKRVPLQRLGKPEEQARAALFLASSESDYVNGSLLCVDGGVYALSPATSTEALAEEI